MPDREKVIVALENCADFVKCRDCPWDECDGIEHDVVNGVPRNLMLDALELLKGQEPRVLALDEVEDALDTVVWVERPGDENLADGYGLIVMYSHKNGWVCIQRPFGEDPSEDKYDYLAYGKYWRCWSARPTDEQRMEAKWGE